MNELKHYGVLGMKWGVRKRLKSAFTPSIKVGKDKSPISPAEKVSRESKTIVDESQKALNSISRIRKSKQSNIARTMTDAELKTAVNRLNLERSYNSLTQDDTSSGLAYVTEVLSVVGSVVGIVGSSVAIATAINSSKVG